MAVTHRSRRPDRRLSRPTPVPAPCQTVTLFNVREAGSVCKTYLTLAEAAAHVELWNEIIAAWGRDERREVEQVEAIVPAVYLVVEGDAVLHRAPSLGAARQFVAAARTASAVIYSAGVEAVPPLNAKGGVR